MLDMDTRFFFLINHGTSNPVFDAVMPFLTNEGYLLVLPYLLFVFYSVLGKKDASGGSYLVPVVWATAIAFVAFPLAEVIGDGIKDAVIRVRPCHVFEGIRLLVPCPKSFSMPSGHAVTSFAFATPLFYLTRSLITLTLRLFPQVLAASIAFSRVYTGVHYPSDVIAGALLGVGVASLLIIIYEWTINTKRGKEELGSKS